MINNIVFITFRENLNIDMKTFVRIKEVYC